jgi:hypothetical protein
MGMKTAYEVVADQLGQCLAAISEQLEAPTLEQGLAGYTAEDRRRLAEYFNFIDGEIALCRKLADRRSLAARINKAAQWPLIDGLTLRGLTFVFGENDELWHEFEALVDAAGTAPRATNTLSEIPATEAIGFDPE